MAGLEHSNGFPSAMEAEAAFYRAFRELSFVTMASVWASDGVACLHPGHQLLTGHKAVMDSWARILNAHESPQLRYELDLAQSADDLSIHNVREIIAPGPGQPAVTVQAVNAYRKFSNGWLMILHHAALPVLSGQSGQSTQRTTQPLQ